MFYKDLCHYFVNCLDNNWSVLKFWIHNCCLDDLPLFRYPYFFKYFFFIFKFVALIEVFEVSYNLLSFILSLYHKFVFLKTQVMGHSDFWILERNGHDDGLRQTNQPRGTRQSLLPDAVSLSSIQEYQGWYTYSYIIYKWNN